MFVLYSKYIFYYSGKIIFPFSDVCRVPEHEPHHAGGAGQSHMDSLPSSSSFSSFWPRGFGHPLLPPFDRGQSLRRPAEPRPGKLQPQAGDSLN